VTEGVRVTSAVTDGVTVIGGVTVGVSVGLAVTDADPVFEGVWVQVAVCVTEALGGTGVIDGDTDDEDVIVWDCV
jgi:hypothetical protein